MTEPGAQPPADGAQPGPERRLPQPHRCNDRVEDFIQALYTLEFGAKIRPSWRNFRQCMASEPGQEPKHPYLVITDGQQYLERRQRADPPKNFMK